MDEFKKLLVEMNTVPFSDWKEYLKEKFNNPSYLDDTTMLAIHIKE